MERILSEKTYYGCTLDDVKQAIADGALPRAYAQIVDGNPKMVTADYLGKVDHDENGNRVEHTWFFEWSDIGQIREYLNEDYEGGFYV